MEDGYAICLNEWVLDNSIKGELGLLLIISSLTAKEGFCYASNEYFAKLFKTTEQTISKKIKKLEQKNYITISYKKRGCEVISRKIRLTKMLIDDYRKRESTINENVKENNTSINNTSINKEKIYKKEKFKKPTIDEVRAYINEKSFSVIPEAFIDYYESNGWKVGKNQMKDWKATLRGWNRRETKPVETKPSWYGVEFEEERASDEEIKKIERALNGI